MSAGIFPDQRLFRCFAQAVKGVIAAGVPIATRMTAVLQSRDPRRTFHVAKRFHRWLENPRAIRTVTSSCLQRRRIRFICDRGFDDERRFTFVTRLREAFVIRLYHDRSLEARQGKGWQEQHLEKVVRHLLRLQRFESRFKIHGRWRIELRFGHKLGHPLPHPTPGPSGHPLPQLWLFGPRFPARALGHACARIKKIVFRCGGEAAATKNIFSLFFCLASGGFRIFSCPLPEKGQTSGRG